MDKTLPVAAHSLTFKLELTNRSLTCLKSVENTMLTRRRERLRLKRLRLFWLKRRKRSEHGKPDAAQEEKQAAQEEKQAELP